MEDVVKRLTVLCVASLLACCITVTQTSAPAPDAPDEDLPTEKRLMMLVDAPELLDSQHSGFLLGSPTGITSNRHTSIQIEPAGFDGGDPDPAMGPNFDQFPSAILGSLPADPQPILAMSLGVDFRRF